MNRTFDDIVREEQREYFRKWRAANPEKVKQHNKNYWRKKAEIHLKELEINGKIDDQR